MALNAANRITNLDAHQKEILNVEVGYGGYTACGLALSVSRFKTYYTADPDISMRIVQSEVNRVDGALEYTGRKGPKSSWHPVEPNTKLVLLINVGSERRSRLAVCSPANVLTPFEWP
jgi:hypothetical protein